MGARFKRNKRPGRKIYHVFHKGEVNTGKGPNQIVLDEYKARTASLKLDAKQLAAVEALFGVNPRAVDAREKANETQRVFGTKKSVNQIGTVAWTGDRHHGLHLFVREIITDGVRELSLYFFMEEAFFLEYNKISGIMRRSIVYQGREKALMYRRAGRIDWLAYVKIEGG